MRNSHAAVYNTVDLSKLQALSEGLRSRTMKAKQGSGKAWFSFENRAVTDTTEIYIYDEIGEWGVTAQDFVNELRGVNTRNVDLHLNCRGGMVFDGLAIYAALRNHPANVTVYVDALAASAASFIAQAGARRIMEPNARMMIHDAHGICIGNAEDAREMAKLLDDTSDNIADIYAERAGGDIKTWRKAMKNETWYSAEEAVAAGLADEISGSSEPENKLSDKPTAQAPALQWDPTTFGTLIKEAVA